MLLLPEFCESGRGDGQVRKSTDTLYKDLQHPLLNSDDILLEVGRMRAYGYKTGLFPTNGGVVHLSKAKPGELYINPKPLDTEPVSEREKEARKLLAKLRYPERVNQSNLAEAVQIGKLKARLWKIIEQERRKYATIR